MSTQEIIAELPKLNPEDLRLVKRKLAELEAGASQVPQTGWAQRYWTSPVRRMIYPPIFRLTTITTSMARPSRDEAGLC